MTPEMIETMILRGDIKIYFQIFDGPEIIPSFPKTDEDVVGYFLGYTFLMDNSIAEPE
jgi:hypothetical protein